MANTELRSYMIEKDVTIRELAKHLGYGYECNLSRRLSKELNAGEIFMLKKAVDAIAEAKEQGKILPDAVIGADGSVRCPICNRLYFKLTGEETVKNLVIFCRGRDSHRGKHEFLLNFGKGE